MIRGLASTNLLRRRTRGITRVLIRTSLEGIGSRNMLHARRCIGHLGTKKVGPTTRVSFGGANPIAKMISKSSKFKRIVTSRTVGRTVRVTGRGNIKVIATVGDDRYKTLDCFIRGTTRRGLVKVTVARASGVIIPFKNGSTFLKAGPVTCNMPTGARGPFVLSVTASGMTLKGVLRCGRRKGRVPGK